MKRLQNVLTTLFTAAALVATVTAPAFAGDRKAVPIPTEPKEMTFKSLRGVQYGEVWLFAGTPQTGLRVVYYNTSDLNNKENPKDTCPPDLWAKVNTKELMAKYDVYLAYKNGPRGWTMDSITIPVGPVESFFGVQARWWGQGVLPKGKDFEGAPPAYYPVQSYRKSSFTFEKGKPVFIIDAPDGTPYVMQAFSKIKDPSLTYDGLKDLGSKLKLAPGWKFRVVTLDRELVISTPQGYNWIAFDDLGNCYDGCKEGASNFVPKPQAQPTVKLTDPFPIKAENWRGRAFYEILFMNRQPDGGGVGFYYNSLGNDLPASNDVMDARFRALKAETLMKEYGSDAIIFNGPRRLVANGATVVGWFGGKERVIEGFPLRVLGIFETPDLGKAASATVPTYKVLVSRRSDSIFFKAGETVYELITPEGAVYTMFSLSLKVDPKNTIENLPTLGKRLTLPEGWQFRSRKLDKDMTLTSTADSNPPNTIVLDQFEGNYQYNAAASAKK